MAYDSWLAMPVVREHVNRRITGGDEHWLDYTLAEYLALGAFVLWVAMGD